MSFSNRIVRPPFEKRSIPLKVTRGCSHNKCLFCNYYRSSEFSISSKEAIVSDLRKLVEKKISYNRVWLQSADAFGLDYEKLCVIAGLIHEYLPYVKTFGSYARVDSLNNKSVSQLGHLKNLGYDSIVFGTESADDYLLQYMRKGYSSKEILKQLSKMDSANMKYTLIFMNGLGGHGYGLTHARKTAKIFNKLHPERIMINNLIIHNDTPLYSKAKDDNFAKANNVECIMELMTFIDSLKIDTFIDATNNTNIIPFFGKSKNKEVLIAKLNNELEKIG